jgi:hypothetical protein
VYLPQQSRYIVTLLSLRKYFNVETSEAASEANSFCRQAFEIGILLPQGRSWKPETFSPKGRHKT